MTAKSLALSSAHVFFPFCCSSVQSKYEIWHRTNRIIKLKGLSVRKSTFDKYLKARPERCPLIATIEI